MKRIAFKFGYLPVLLIFLYSNNASAFYSTEKIDPILKEAHSYLGTRWVLGRTDRRAIDCSALVQNSFSAVGINIPRTSRSQFAYKKGIKLSKKDNYQKGDLLFFSSGGHYVGHVGIVSMVENGRIRFIHSSSNNGKVAYDYLEGHYSKTFVGGRRLFNAFEVNDAPDSQGEMELAFEWIPEFPGKKEIVNIETERPRRRKNNEICFHRNKPDYEAARPRNRGKYSLNPSAKLLTWEDIQGLKPCEIKILKNEIFARHGYDFHRNRFIENYFESQTWYRKIRRKTRNERFVKRHFSDIEKANVIFLARHEGVCD